GNHMMADTVAETRQAG
ncbi:hypothetical protein Tco_1521043, partial [Tanacetum coccineum]